MQGIAIPKGQTSKYKKNTLLHCEDNPRKRHLPSKSLHHCQSLQILSPPDEQTTLINIKSYKVIHWYQSTTVSCNWIVKN